MARQGARKGADEGGYNPKTNNTFALSKEFFRNRPETKKNSPSVIMSGNTDSVIKEMMKDIENPIYPRKRYNLLLQPLKDIITTDNSYKAKIQQSTMKNQVVDELEQEEMKKQLCIKIRKDLSSQGFYDDEIKEYDLKETKK